MPFRVAYHRVKLYLVEKRAVQELNSIKDGKVGRALLVFAVMLMLKWDESN